MVSDCDYEHLLDKAFKIAILCQFLMDEKAKLEKRINELEKQMKEKS